MPVKKAKVNSRQHRHEDCLKAREDTAARCSPAHNSIEDPVAMHRLELILLQFLMLVVLPTSDVGTPELPAITATKIGAAAASRPVGPGIGKPPAISCLGHERPHAVPGRACELRPAGLSLEAAWHLKQRLQI
jgi:hypothetical protein